jgi:type I restriction enzyme R subunit
MVKNFISEDNIEQALLQRLKDNYGYELLNCYTAKADDLGDGSNRTDKKEVILKDRLKTAIQKLNPTIPEKYINEAIETIAKRRTAMSDIKANLELYNLIRDGIPIEYEDDHGKKQTPTLKLIDFNESKNNQFLAVSQLWIHTTARTPKAQYRRPDVILYINGIPLVFIELKNSNVKLRTAYDDNLQNYRHDIPQLFHYNGFCILSNAIETKIGSFAAGWDRFFGWFRSEDEKETIDRKQASAQGTTLEYVLKGLCEKTRLLDYLENFILFQNKDGIDIKIIAQNHQYLGVNNTYDRFLKRHEYQGKLGVFWHTQGSGKSFSMIFLVRKITRKVTGNFNFVVVTDRNDLDGQIYKNFLSTGVITKKEAVQPKDAEELRKFLTQNKKIIFTLIHKFRYPKGQTYPRLFDPDKDGREMIVMVDEAHRTQYESLAENMRAGLEGANFIAFTGTPLLGKDRKTNQWFGDYVSEYNFQQAMEDNATVPLFYEKRVPQVLIQNDELSEEFYELLEDENLDDQQQYQLERKFAKEIEVIKNPNRLNTIAQDIVYHFPRRGYLGKAMVVCVDKFTAVTMYEKVQHHWKEERKRLQGLSYKATNDIEKARYKKMIEYMKSVEMAVVISDPSADKEKFAEKGLNIEPHIKRLETLDEQGHDIEYNFKDPTHPLQIVFVCAMWLTGFDAPTVSTLYLDKPMKNHTLMQAIARANRVTSFEIKNMTGKLVEKKNGEIVDYYNVFRNMKQALRDYAQGEDKDSSDESPVQEKDKLFQLLDDAIQQTFSFCRERDVPLEAVTQSEDVLSNLEQFQAIADTLLSQDEWYKAYGVYHNTVLSLYEACKPEILKKKQDYNPAIAVIQYLQGVIDAAIERTNIDHVTARITELLDESIVVNEAEQSTLKEHQASYSIIQQGKTWDLSKTNFEKLKEDFPEKKYKNIEITEIRSFIEEKLQQMVEQNFTRVDFAERLQHIIDRYNSGASSTENYYEELVNFAQSMKEETERHHKEGLTEDELELFDLLKKDKLTKAEEQNVKLAAKSLIQRLKEGQPKVLVQDWWKDTQTQKKVEDTIEEVLDENLPSSYDRLTFKDKCDKVFTLVIDFARNQTKWVA